MKNVYAALGHQRDLCARTLPLIRTIIRGGDPKFLNRILSHGENRSECISIRLIIHVDVVECDVALIAPRAIHGAIARILVFVTDAIARVNNPGLQTQQVGNIPALERNLPHLCFIKGIAEGSINHVDGRHLGRDGDDFGRGADLELNVGRGRGIHQQGKILLFITAKARCLYGQCVASGRNKKKLVLALIPSCHGALGLRFAIRKYNRGARDGVSIGIRYGAPNRCGGLCVSETAAERASQQSQGQSQQSRTTLREPRTKQEKRVGQGVISSHIFPFPNAICFGD